MLHNLLLNLRSLANRPIDAHLQHQSHQAIRLTSSELGALWTQYVNDSMSICILKYFIKDVEDPEIRAVVDYALRFSQSQVQTLRDLFHDENFPIPIGFSDQDVNLNAPRLFSDVYILLYLRHMAIIGMAAAGIAVGMVSREDVSTFFLGVLEQATELHNRARKVSLAKGVYIRPPSISIPEKVDFAEKQNFLSGFFGEKRSLTSIEISHLFNNFLTNALGKSMVIGFGQVSTSPDVKKYFQRGKDIASKHMEIFSKILIEEDLPAPMSYDSYVLDSTVAPFSERLMVFHIALLSSVGIGNYGTAAGTCARSDLNACYTRLSAEIALYAQDGANLMIQHGWLEEPPQADDRDPLIRVH